MFIIKDWAGNNLFKDKTFKTFEDAWDHIFEYFNDKGMDADEWAQEYDVCEEEFLEDGSLA